MRRVIEREKRKHEETKKQKRHGEKRENKNDEREQLRKSKNKESKHKNKEGQFVFRVFFLNRNKEIKTKETRYLHERDKKKEKFKIMHEKKTNQKQKFCQNHENNGFFQE